MNRYVWNKALGMQKERLDSKEKVLKYNELAKLLPEWKKDSETIWLKEAPSQTLQQTLKFLDRAIWQGFSKTDLKRFPVFKKKGRHDSFRYPQGYKIEAENNRIFLPKVGWISYINSRELIGEPKNITISRRGKHWYASIQTEIEVETPVHKSTKIVGIDLGVRQFAALSSGEMIAPLNSLRKKGG